MQKYFAGGDSLGLAEEACVPCGVCCAPMLCAVWCAPMGAALAAVADAAAGAAVSRKLRRWSGLRISSVREPGVQRQGAAMPRIGVWCKPGAKNTIRILQLFVRTAGFLTLVLNASRIVN